MDGVPLQGLTGGGNDNALIFYAWHFGLQRYSNGSNSLIFFPSFFPKKLEAMLVMNMSSQPVLEVVILFNFI